MKHFYLFLLLISGNSLFSQSVTVKNTSAPKVEVTEMPVYPGCDKVYSPKQKIEMSQCLQQNLSTLLTEKLKHFNQLLDVFNVREIRCMINFRVGTDGKIGEITSTNSYNYLNNLLAVGAIDAMKQISNEIGYIKPAKNANGEQVSLLMALPVKFRIEYLKKPVPISKFDFAEVVQFTLKAEDKTYEIRRDEKTGKINVYDVSKKNSVLVEQFDSLEKAFQKEPYRSLYLADGKKHLIAEAKEDGKLFRLYSDSDNPDSFFLYSVSGETEKLEETITKSLFGWSKYSVLLLR